MARATVDDIRELLAYFRIKAEDEAQAQFKRKLEEMHAKKRATM